VRSRAEAAALLGTTVEDLDLMLLGDRHIYLSRSAQRERSNYNHGASVAVDKLAPTLKVALYGDVVVTRAPIEEAPNDYEEN
jgi:hypothetical protein